MSRSISSSMPGSKMGWISITNRFSITALRESRPLAGSRLNSEADRLNAKAGILGILLALGAARADAEPLPRVASVSICADQFLLTLADPAQIAALSAQSRD